MSTYIILAYQITMHSENAKKSKILLTWSSKCVRFIETEQKKEPSIVAIPLFSHKRVIEKGNGQKQDSAWSIVGRPL